MLRVLAKVLLKIVAGLTVLIFVGSLQQYLPIARSTFKHDVELTDLLYGADTFQSHRLLVDGGLTVYLDDLDRQGRDLSRIDKLFPDADERAKVLEWGRRLFDQCRGKHLA